MSSIWTQKDPTKKFTETKDPLANTDPLEGSPFPYEDTLGGRPWGQFNFLYDSPFTTAKFGYLSDYDSGQGQLPGPSNVPSGDIAPASGGGGGGTGDVDGAVALSQEQICTPCFGQNTDDQVTSCHGFLPGCDFFRFFRLWHDQMIEVYNLTDSKVGFDLYKTQVVGETEIFIDSTCPTYDMWVTFENPTPTTSFYEITLTRLDTGATVVNETASNAADRFTLAVVITAWEDFWDAVAAHFASVCTICSITADWEVADPGCFFKAIDTHP